jgi:hypothetical protein
MAIKFAKDIVTEIRKRGPIEVPEGYITGEDFEASMYNYKETFRVKNSDDNGLCIKNLFMPAFNELNFFPENYGEAA